MYIYLLCPIGKHSRLSALLQIWNCAMIYGLCRSTFLTALFSRPFVGKDCVRLQFKGDCVSKRNIISRHMHHHVFLQTLNSAQLGDLKRAKTTRFIEELNGVSRLFFSSKQRAKPFIQKQNLIILTVHVYIFHRLFAHVVLQEQLRKKRSQYDISLFSLISFFFYQRLTFSHSFPQDKALQIYSYETDQFITNGWVQRTYLVQRILVLNIFASLTYACYYLMNWKKKSLN